MKLNSLFATFLVFSATSVGVDAFQTLPPHVSTLCWQQQYSSATNENVLQRIAHDLSIPLTIRSPSQLYASSPQYDTFEGTLETSHRLADNSYLLHITAPSNDDSESILPYKPGHVIALEIKADTETSGQNPYDRTEKTLKDLENNDGWLRAPFTITRSTKDSFDILIKVVGDKSYTLAHAPENTPIRFGGKFKVPIEDGIVESMEKAKESGGSIDKIVMISTGVGVGPCIGAIENMLSNQLEDDDPAENLERFRFLYLSKEQANAEAKFPKVELLGLYRENEDVVYGTYLTALKEKFARKFDWQSILSNYQGRLSSTENMMSYYLCSKGTDFRGALENTHYHLIGNGSMVNELREGLLKAGVSKDRITEEIYFNHTAKPSEDVVDRIAKAINQE